MSHFCCPVTKKVHVFPIHAGPKCQEVLSYHSFKLAWGLPPKSWCFLLKEIDRSVFFQYSIIHGCSLKIYHHSSIDAEKVYFLVDPLDNLRVKMYSYPSFKSSYISVTSAFKVTTKALEFCFVGRKSEICALSDHFLKNLIFPSCKSTALIKKFDVYVFLKFAIVHQHNINSRKFDMSVWSEK